MDGGRKRTKSGARLCALWRQGRRLVSTGAVLLLICGVSAKGDSAEGLGAVAETATAEKVAAGFRFTEGPVWHSDGYLLFSDIPANQIVKWTAPGKTETFREPSGQSNGLTFDRQGRLLACEHANRRVSRTEADGKVVAIVDKYQGKRLNSPNDLVVKSDGSIYFTDPPYGIRSADEKELSFNGVFLISPRGELTLLASDFDRPNGIALSPDEKKLYVADTARSHVRVFDISSDGTLKDGKVFVNVPGPDGMSIDSKGNLYVTSNGVAVFDAKGKKLGEIKVPERPANCGFGGTDNKTLFVTARTSLYRIKLKVSGLKVGPAAVGK